MGLELGWQRAVGICAVPLWPLGVAPERLGLGAGGADCPAGVCAGAGGLGGWRSL